MLGKLIRYETGAFGRIMLPLYGAALGFALFLGLSLRFLPNDFLGGLPTILLGMVYGILLVGVMIMTGILAVTRFYGNLLGKEGYLMFSLPTGTMSLISSKVICAILWSALSTITAFLTIFLCALGAGGTEVLKGFSDFFNYFTQWENFGTAMLMTAVTCLLLIVTAAGTIIKIFAAIAVGHQFQNHRIAGSVVGYIAFQMVETTLQSIISFAGYHFGFVEAFSELFETETVSTILLTEWWSIGIGVLKILIYGALAFLLLDRKLNLE